MTFRNTSIDYGWLTKVFHWLVFLLVVGMIISGFLMTDVLAKSLKPQVYMIHKSFGLCILALMLIRISWMLINIRPQLPNHFPEWQRKLANSIHGLLYIALLAMPLSGWIMSTASNHIPTFFGWFAVPMPWMPLSKPLAEFAGETHEILAWTIVVLVSLHILAALKHHFIDKDFVLRRMWF